MPTAPAATVNGFTFEPLCTSYSIEIEDKAFLDLLDSESYVTDHAAFAPDMKPLSERLHHIPGVRNVEYNGHFGAAIFFDIEAEYDHAETKAMIAHVVNTHLEWCASLEKREDVVKRRAAEQAT